MHEFRYVTLNDVYCDVIFIVNNNAICLAEFNLLLLVSM